MTIEERVLRLEAAFVTLTQLARSMDERMDTSDGRMNELEEKMAALVDAQITTEERIQALSDATGRRLGELADIQARTSEDIARLTNLVAGIVQRLT
jgi:chromosome segregation ATPase